MQIPTHHTTHSGGFVDQIGFYSQKRNDSGLPLWLSALFAN